MSKPILPWIGNITIIISAVIVSISISASISWWSFVGFPIGHTLYMYDSYSNKNYPILVLNSALLLIDIYAISIRTSFF